MRIWHKKLISKLCRQHLLACWREGLGCYAILINNKKGYRNHPVVREFENGKSYLIDRLMKIRYEMILRGYHPKEIPHMVHGYPPLEFIASFNVKPWQSLKKQIEILKSKKCQCKV